MLQHRILSVFCFSSSLFFFTRRYAPSAVVLATGGTTALAANVTYIVISQLSECTSFAFYFCVPYLTFIYFLLFLFLFFLSLDMFVCAVKTAAWEGTKATFRVAKYVFITKPLGLNSGPSGGEILQLSGDGSIDEGWVLVGEGEDPVAKQGAIRNLLQALTRSNKQPNASSPSTIIDITEEDINESLVLVTKIADELSPQGTMEGVELVDEEGVVFEEAWDQSVEKEVSGVSKKSEEEGFIMV